MTKGKYAARAANRQAELEAAGNLSMYQAKVVKLTAENKALRERLTDKDRAHSREVRRLKVERNEGVSPALAVVESQNRQLRDELTAAKQHHAEIKKRWERLIPRVIAHFKSAHGMTGLEAEEEVVHLLNPNQEQGRVTIVTDDVVNLLKRTGMTEEVDHYGDGKGKAYDIPAESTADAVVRIQRARGMRR